MKIKDAVKMIEKNAYKLEVKTYKYRVLCELLEIEPKKNNPKKAQIKELERYAEVEPIGHNVIVSEVYDFVADKIENRGGHKTAVAYSENIQALVLDLLVRDDLQLSGISYGCVLLGQNALLRTLSMTNQNYAKYKREPEKLADLLDMNVYAVREWYSLNGRMIERNLETALDKLKSKSLIDWDKVTMMCFESYEDGQARTYHRLATDEERVSILEVESELLDTYGCKNKGQIVMKNRWSEFSSEVVETLVKLYDMDGLQYTYKGYKILFSKAVVSRKRDALNTESRLKEQSNVNNGIFFNIEDNAQGRHQRAIKNGDDENIRSFSDYVPNSNQMTSKLVSIKSLVG